MTYRIAFVRFTQNGRAYPVNCDRSDLAQNDIVVVRLLGLDGRLKVARVDRVEFLNWHCKNTLICKRSEYARGEDGRYRIKRDVAPGTVETLADLEEALHNAVWQKMNVSNGMVIRQSS
jgi:hypothetical protein